MRRARTVARPNWMYPMTEHIDALIARDYQAGFVTDIVSDTLPPGLNEEVVQFISARNLRAARDPAWQ